MASGGGKKRTLTGRTFLCLLAVFVFLSGCQELASRRKIQRGNEAYTDGEYETAVTLYKQALKSQPQLAIGWYNLGIAYLGIFSPGLQNEKNDKMAREAIPAFKEYLKRFPDDTTARDAAIGTSVATPRARSP